jgi:hypothetical protein
LTRLGHQVPPPRLRLGCIWGWLFGLRGGWSAWRGLLEVGETFLSGHLSQEAVRVTRANCFAARLVAAATRSRASGPRYGRVRATAARARTAPHGAPLKTPAPPPARMVKTDADGSTGSGADHPRSLEEPEALGTSAVVCWLEEAWL